MSAFERLESQLIEPRLNNICRELQDCPQWVVWKAAKREKPDGTVKIIKVPYDPKTGKKASTRKRGQWGTFDDVCNALLDYPYTGVGFVFTEDDPFVGLDLDNCYDDTGNLSDEANEAISACQSYTERSPSGNGLHIICKARLPGRGHCDNQKGLEMYQEGRFFTITGDTLEGLNSVSEAHVAVTSLYRKWFGQSASNDASHFLRDLVWDPEAPLVSLDDMPIQECFKGLIRSGDGMERYTNETGGPDRSLALYVVCEEMLNVGINTESILAVLTDSANYLASKALDERNGNRSSAQQWLWQHTLAKVMRRRQASVDEFDPIEFDETGKPLGWLKDFTVSDEEMESIENSEFIIDGFIVRGHLTFICAEANAGKTTLFFHLAGEMAEKNYRVVYVNADVSAGDAKPYHAKAKEIGITLLLPDMKVGESMDGVLKRLEQMLEMEGDYSDYVFIFDTWKKMCEVLNKSDAKRVLNLLRALTGRGMTVVVLAHTNKYLGENGLPIYEGTGDTRNDSDELIYLIPEKLSDGSILVSTLPDKTRAKIQEKTWRISPDREVCLQDEYEDILARKKERSRLSDDQEVVERITERLISGDAKQSELVEYCREHGISQRRARACIRRYSQHDETISTVLWREESGELNNAKIYSLVDCFD